MRCIVLTTILLLLLSLIIVLGDEAFATTEIPNMTLTEPSVRFYSCSKCLCTYIS